MRQPHFSKALKDYYRGEKNYKHFLYYKIHYFDLLFFYRYLKLFQI